MLECSLDDSETDEREDERDIIESKKRFAIELPDIKKKLHKRNEELAEPKVNFEIVREITGMANNDAANEAACALPKFKERGN